MKKAACVIVERVSRCALVVSFLGLTNCAQEIRHVTIDFESFSAGTVMAEQYAEMGLHFDGGLVVGGETAGDSGTIKLDGVAGPKFLLMNGILTIRSDHQIIDMSASMATAFSRTEEKIQAINWGGARGGGSFTPGGDWRGAWGGNFDNPIYWVQYNALLKTEYTPVYYGVDDIRFTLAVIPEPTTTWLISVGAGVVALRGLCRNKRQNSTPN